MTGRYPYNTGLMEYGKVISEERSAVPLSFQMLPKLLTQHAPTPYKACTDISRTAFPHKTKLLITHFHSTQAYMLGKWHLVRNRYRQQ